MYGSNWWSCLRNNTNNAWYSNGNNGFFNNNNMNNNNGCLPVSNYPQNNGKNNAPRRCHRSLFLCKEE